MVSLAPGSTKFVDFLTGVKKRTLNGLKCAMGGAVRFSIENRGRKWKNFAVSLTEDVNETLKFQSLQFQLRYRSLSTFPSNSK